MPLPEDFGEEALYAPEAWFLDDIVEMNDDATQVIARLDTTRLGALVGAQRPWPGHAKHLPGAVAIQMTGTLGNLHAFYGLGLRPSEGWVGHGVAIRSARFTRLGRIGPDVIAKMTVTRVRNLRGQYFVSYQFELEQEGESLYRSEQTAVWHRHTPE